MANTSIRVDTVGLGIAWSLNETYRVAIDEGFLLQDGGLNLPITGGNLTTFTTPANPPQIGNTTPTHTSTAPIGIQNISFGIDRANVTVLGGNVVLNRQGSPNLAVKTYTVSNVNTTGNVVSFSVVGNLEASQTYFVTSDANIFLDRDGFKNNAITNSSSFRFISPSAPQLTTTTPANASVAAVGIQNVNLLFDRTITANNGNLFLYLANTNQLIKTISITSGATISNANVSFSVVGNLEADQKYYVTTNANIVQDATLIKYPGITTANTYNFFAPNAPQLISTYPTTGNTNTLENETIRLTFDRSVTANSGNLYLYKVSAPDILLNTYNVNSSATFANANVSLDIRGWLDAGATHYITSDANIAQDATLIKYPGITSTNTFIFTTSVNHTKDWPTVINNGVYTYTTSKFGQPSLISNTRYSANTYMLRLRTIDTVYSMQSSANTGTLTWTLLGAGSPWSTTYGSSSVQGYRGGTGGTNSAAFAGGGGGAGNVGLNNIVNYGGDGGPGYQSNITGTNVYYGGGGGGGATESADGAGAGGSGGGGAGSKSNTAPTVGTVNTGGGGGGAGSGAAGVSSASGANGGSGVVILRYIANETNISATGGTTSTSGDYTIHTFNSSGNLVITSNYSSIIEYLIVAGGGGGGAGINGITGFGGAGGGGGGGVRYGFTTISSGTYPVVVGAGGAGGVNGNLVSSGVGTNGEDSSWNGITATGGGGGGNGGNSLTYSNGVNGASGGGGGGFTGNGQGSVGGVSSTSSYKTGLLGNCYISGNLIQINSRLANLTLTPITGLSVPSNQLEIRYTLINGLPETTRKLQTLDYSGNIFPSAPVIGTAYRLSNTSANISYTASSSQGSSAIISYTAISTPGNITGTLSTSGSGNITVNASFAANTSYTFKVYATNSLGDSNLSAASNSIAPYTPGNPDTYWGNVQLLLKGGETSGSSTFVDLSQNNFSFTKGGDPTYENTQTKYAATSIYFDGNDRLTVTNDDDLKFSTGDWTWEFWAYPTTSPSFCGVIGFGTYGRLLIGRNRGTWYVECDDGNLPSVSVTISGGTWTANSWQHIAVTRSGNDFRAFLNGTQFGSTISSGVTLESTGGYGAPQAGLEIGSFNGESSYYTGYLEDIRFTKGVARYTANFTAPTAGFPTNGIT